MTIIRHPDRDTVHHPVVAQILAKQAEELQLRIADLITRFAGSMLFLSTFVMIGQNRQAVFQQQKADHDFVAQEQELHVNTELTRTVEQLTREIHGAVLGTPPRAH